MIILFAFLTLFPRAGSSGTYSEQFASGNSNEVYGQVTNQLIAVGKGATSEVMSPNGQYIYVAEYGSAAVGVVNVLTNSVISIPVGYEPEIVAVNPNGTIVAAANVGENTVSIIGTSTDTVINTIILTGRTQGVGFDPSGGLLYAGYGYILGSVGGIDVINVATNAIVNTISFGSNIPYYVALNPSGTLAYVTNNNGGTGNSVSVINTATNTVVNVITVGTDPYGVTFNPQGTLAYVANHEGRPSTVSVINVAANAVVNTIIIDNGGGTGFGYAATIAINPSGNIAWVTDHHSGNIKVIDTSTNSIIYNISLSVGGTSSNPRDIVINNNGTMAYVLNSTSLFSGASFLDVVNVSDSALLLPSSTTTVSSSIYTTTIIQHDSQGGNTITFLFIIGVIIVIIIIAILLYIGKRGGVRHG